MKKICDDKQTESESILCLDSFINAHTTEAVAAVFVRQKVYTVVITDALGVRRSCNH
jgi:hypothetical protein